MKLEWNEQIKHRLVGLAVIISLVAIFAPAVMKKSGQRMDKDLSMHMQLPDKPKAPNVAVVDKDKVFKTMKVAHVEMPVVSEKERMNQLAQLETSLALTEEKASKNENFVASIPPLVKNETTVKVKETIYELKKPELKVSNQATIKIQKSVILALNQEIYSVQLASFAKKENAEVLVSRLKSKGYIGKIIKVGNQYKVYVGKSPNKEHALKLKNRIATALRINGFVVSGVA